MIVFISGRLARILGFVGSRMSMIDTVSLPGGWFTVLPVSSNHTFSSLPVISSCARATPAINSRPPANAQSGSNLDHVFIVPSIRILLPPVCHALGGGVTPWRCIDCSSVSLPKMLLMPAVVTLDLDAGGLRQKIHGARDFPWTTQPANSRSAVSRRRRSHVLHAHRIGWLGCSM